MALVLVEERLLHLVVLVSISVEPSAQHQALSGEMCVVVVVSPRTSLMVVCGQTLGEILLHVTCVNTVYGVFLEQREKY